MTPDEVRRADHRRDIARRHMHMRARLNEALGQRDLPALLQACSQEALGEFENHILCPLARVCHEIEHWDLAAMAPLIERCTAHGLDAEQPPLGLLLQLPASPQRDAALSILALAGADFNRLIDRSDIANTDEWAMRRREACPAWLHGLLLSERFPIHVLDQAGWRPTDWARWPTAVPVDPASGPSALPAHPLAAVCSLWGDGGIRPPLEGGTPTQDRAQRAVAWLVTQGLSWDDPWEGSTVLDCWRRWAPGAAEPHALAHRLPQIIPAARPVCAPARSRM